MNNQEREVPESVEQALIEPSGLSPSRWWHRLAWGLLPVTPMGLALFLPRIGAIKLMAIYSALAALSYLLVGLTGIARALRPDKRTPGRQRHAPPRTPPTA